MYRIIGGDQKTYGPVTQDQIEQWIREGRANAQTLVQLEGVEGWKPLSSYPEFAAGLSARAVAAPPPPSAAMPYSAPASLPSRKSNGMATAGFILSLLGFLCCGPIFSLLGLTFCCIALTQISKDPSQSGRGLAIAGIVFAVLGFISFAILLASGVLKEVLRNLGF